MTVTWRTVSFAVGVDLEAVSRAIGSLAAEPRRGLVASPASLIFETVLGPDSVDWRIGGAEPLRRFESHLERALPGVFLSDTARGPVSATAALELRLRSSRRPLELSGAADCAAAMLGISAELGAHEQLTVRWVIGPWLARSPVPPATGARVERSIWNLPDWGLPHLSSEETTAARKKLSEPNFAAIGRIAVSGATGSRAWQLLNRTVGAYQLLRAPGVGFSKRKVSSRCVRRRLEDEALSSVDPAVRLMASEVAAVIGWPIGNPTLPGVRYVRSRLLPVDPDLLVPLGDDRSRRLLGTTTSEPLQGVELQATAGLRHLHVLGPTGVGKSTLLANLILADVAAGRGAAVIDPKGDLVTDVLARLPDEATDRVAVLDPADPAPLGFNPLADGPAGVDGLLHVMASLWASSWGPRLGDVLHAGLLTLAGAGDRSLAELPLLFNDASFRRPLVAGAMQRDPLGLGSFWPWFEALSDEQRAQVLAPVMNKLRAFLLRPELRAVLGQATPRFDLSWVFSDRQILLVRLPKGELGPGSAELLGSLLVSSLWRAAQRRVRKPGTQRRPVFIYLDEFQEFLRLPVDLGDAMVQARGLGVGLVLAHQQLAQLSPGLRAAVLANSGSRVIFRLDHDDAAAMAKRSGGSLDVDDITQLSAFQAYASVMVNDAPSAFGSITTRQLTKPSRSVQRFMADYRMRFGVPAEQTEKHLRDLVDRGPGGDPSAGPGGALGGRRVQRGRS
jgi:hypothetical protein